MKRAFVPVVLGFAVGLQSFLYYQQSKQLQRAWAREDECQALVERANAAVTMGKEAVESVSRTMDEVLLRCAACLARYPDI